MSTGHTAAVVVLGVLLTLTLGVGNVVFAAHATVLDPGFATEAIDQEDGYTALASEFEQALTEGDEARDSGGDQGDRDDAGGADAGDASSFGELLEREGVYEDALSPEYLESQVDPNVHRIYAYLHGNGARLNLSMDAEPLADNASVAAEAAVANATTAELLGLADDDPLGDVPVEESTIEMLDQGPDAYAQAQADVRENVYEEVLDGAVEEGLQERSKDELLALVIPDYDPDDYSESEKEQMVRERDEEIRTALRTQIEEERDDELQATTDDELDAIREDVKSDDVSTGQASFDGPVRELRDGTADALTTDVDHETYQQEADVAKSDLATDVGEHTHATVEAEYGSSVDLNEAMEIPEQDAFGVAASTGTWLDRLAIVLPAVALVLIGLVYYLTRSVGRTLGTVGWGMVWTGLPAFVGATVLADRLPSMMGAGGDPNAIQSLTLSIFQGTVGHLAAQSLWVGAVGGLFLAISLGARYGRFERFGGDSVETADGVAVETGATDDPLADRGAEGEGRAGSGGTQTDSTASGTSQQDDR